MPLKIIPGIDAKGNLASGLSVEVVQETLKILPTTGGTMLENASIAFANNTLIQEGGVGIQLVCSVAYPMRWEQGRLWFFQQDGVTVRSVHEQFDTPGNLDDVTQGFVPGSRWYLTDGRVFECDTNSEETAAWNDVTPVNSIVLLDYATISYVDNSLVSYVGSYVDAAIAAIDLSSYATTSAVAAGYQPLASFLTTLAAINATTGTGALVRAASPTVTGTLSAAAIIASGISSAQHFESSSAADIKIVMRASDSVCLLMTKNEGAFRQFQAGSITSYGAFSLNGDANITRIGANHVGVTNLTASGTVAGRNLLTIGSAQTASFTAVAGTLHPINLSSVGADLTITMPATPTTNDVVGVYITHTNASFEAIWNRNGNTMRRGTDVLSFPLRQVGEFLIWQWDGGDWVLIEDGRIAQRCYGYLNTGIDSHYATGSNTRVPIDTESFDLGGIMQTGTATAQIVPYRSGVYEMQVRAQGLNTGVVALRANIGGVSSIIGIRTVGSGNDRALMAGKITVAATAGTVFFAEYYQETGAATFAVGRSASDDRNAIYFEEKL